MAKGMPMLRRPPPPRAKDAPESGGAEPSAPRSGRGRGCLLALFGLAWRAALLMLLLAAAAEGAGRVAQRVESEPCPMPPEPFLLYTVGGSTMAGEPLGNDALPLAVVRLLGGSVDDRPITICRTARPGESVHSQAVRLARALSLHPPGTPGAVIVYAGHNEGDIPPDAPLTALESLHRALFTRSAAVREIGLRLARDTDRLPRAADHYEAYLRRVVRLARGADLPLVLATPVGNVGLGEPNARLLDLHPGLTRGLRDARAQGEAGDPEGALARLALLRVEHGSWIAGALLRYHEAHAARLAGRTDDWKRLAWQAVAEDPRVIFGRATRAQIEAVRRVAREEGVALADVLAKLEADEPDDVPGPEGFVDMQHPDAPLTAAIARLFAHALAPLIGATIDPGVDDAALVQTMERGRHSNLPRAWAKAGSWLVTVSLRQRLVADRMILARRAYERVIELQPERFAAHVGLALADLGWPKGALADPELVVTLARWSFAYNADFCPPRPGWDELRGHLARLGTAQERLTSLDQLWQRTCATTASP